MKKFYILLFFCSLSVGLTAQTVSRTLSYYQKAAVMNSPLLADLSNQTKINGDELKRLQAMYTRGHAEMTGSCLFVPVISKDNKNAQFEMFKQNGTDYYGYDLGQASSQLLTTVRWTQPLLNKPLYKEMEHNAGLQDDIARNNIRLEKHQLERTVQEQYLLCILDQEEMDFTDTVAALLDRQSNLLTALQRKGLARQTDLQLIGIQKTGNQEMRSQAVQSYRNHLSDLNILCGITDTTLVKIDDRAMAPRTLTPFPFEEKYRLDSLNIQQELRLYNLQYKPQLDFFVDGGLNTAMDKNMYQHFGWSAGLTFRVPLYDGGQRKWKRQQTSTRLETVRAYQETFRRQQTERLTQYENLAAGYRRQEALLEKQLKEYDSILKTYQVEIAAGQMSVVDFVTVLQGKIQTERDRMLLQTNIRLAETALDYWK